MERQPWDEPQVQDLDRPCSLVMDGLSDSAVPCASHACGLAGCHYCTFTLAQVSCSIWPGFLANAAAGRLVSSHIMLGLEKHMRLPSGCSAVAVVSIGASLHCRTAPAASVCASRGQAPCACGVASRCSLMRFVVSCFCVGQEAAHARPPTQQDTLIAHRRPTLCFSNKLPRDPVVLQAVMMMPQSLLSTVCDQASPLNMHTPLLCACHGPQSVRWQRVIATHALRRGSTLVTLQQSVLTSWRCRLSSHSSVTSQRAPIISAGACSDHAF